MKIKLLIILSLCCWSLTSLGQQPMILRGKVTDSKGYPVPGATIFVENQDRRNLKGSSTDANGNYRLEIPVLPELTIVCSSIGYQIKRIPYTNQPSLDIKLEDDVKTLDAVVVQDQKPVERNSLGISYRNQVAATQRFEMKELEQMPFTSVESGLQGRLANVDIVAGTGPGSRSSIRIRGTSSLNANSEPLIVVDGVPYP